MNRIINTEKAPEPVGPYSQAIQSGGLLFISGQIPVNPQTGLIDGKDIKTQTEQVLKNLKEIILAAGMSLASVVKCTCFLQSMNDFKEFNAVYAKYFSDIPPARECVEISKLPKEALIEISAVCVSGV